jgi:hypothetical protein
MGSAQPGKGKTAFISSAWAVRWAQVAAKNPSITICPSPVLSQFPHPTLYMQCWMGTTCMVLDGDSDSDDDI